MAVFAQLQRIYWNCVYCTDCPVLEWILPLYAVVTPYMKQLQGPRRSRTAIDCPLDLEVVLEVYKMTSEWWVFLASSLLLRLISRPPTPLWVRRVKSLTQIFTLILNLLSSPYNTLRLWNPSTKLTVVSRYTKNHSPLFLISGREASLRVRRFVCWMYLQAEKR